MGQNHTTWTQTALLTPLCDLTGIPRKAGCKFDTLVARIDEILKSGVEFAYDENDGVYIYGEYRGLDEGMVKDIKQGTSCVKKSFLRHRS